MYTAKICLYKTINVACIYSKMRFLLVLLFCLLHFALCEKGKKWALLVAGSKSWDNYRHQADVCHAYQLLKAEGIPEENIILMMFDDIAFNQRNPKKGVLINKPNGPNVYEGVIKDYTGKDLNVANFLNVLTGNKTAMKGIGSGRVIESGPKDTIFVNIVDHGSEAMLTINEEYLYADQLNDALKKMKANKKYHQIVMYIEACESGSMFDSIIDDQASVFVMTAAAPRENSMACYYNDELDAFIGDAFSTIWMENMDKIREEWDPSFTTLFRQYKYVRSNVNMSHVMLYGDFRLGFNPVSTYLGEKHKNLKTQIKSKNIVLNQNNQEYEELVDIRDIQTELLNKKLIKNVHNVDGHKIKNKLEKIELGRKLIDMKIDQIVQKLSDDYNLTKTKETMPLFACYRNIISHFNKLCFNTHKHSYVSKHFFKFFEICKNGVNANHVPTVLNNVCQNLNYQFFKHRIPILT